VTCAVPHHCLTRSDQLESCVPALHRHDHHYVGYDGACSVGYFPCQVGAGAADGDGGGRAGEAGQSPRPSRVMVGSLVMTVFDCDGVKKADEHGDVDVVAVVDEKVLGWGEDGVLAVREAVLVVGWVLRPPVCTETYQDMGE